jgi:hypothetical protein
VRSRQFTGRIVTVTNDKVFDEPVFNYTRDFPFIWEEMRLPIAYGERQLRITSGFTASPREVLATDSAQTNIQAAPRVQTTLGPVEAAWTEGSLPLPESPTQ